MYRHCIASVRRLQINYEYNHTNTRSKKIDRDGGYKARTSPPPSRHSISELQFRSMWCPLSSPSIFLFSSSSSFSLITRYWSRSQRQSAIINKNNGQNTTNENIDDCEKMKGTKQKKTRRRMKRGGREYKSWRVCTKQNITNKNSHHCELNK